MRFDSDGSLVWVLLRSSGAGSDTVWLDWRYYGTPAVIWEAWDKSVAAGREVCLESMPVLGVVKVNVTELERITR